MARLLARRDALPEAARAKELAAAASAARDQAVLRRTEAHDLKREVAKLEGEVDKVRARAKRDAELLEAGDVASSRQLIDLQHEIASLQRRQTELEDVELDVMERFEAAEAARSAAERERDELTDQAERARGEAEQAMQNLAAEYRAAKARRAGLCQALPADLLALYEKVSADRGGVAVAEFVNDQCGACRLQMIPADLAVVRTAPVDEVLRCEECRSILVRTALLRS